MRKLLVITIFAAMLSLVGCGDVVASSSASSISSSSSAQMGSGAAGPSASASASEVQADGEEAASAPQASDEGEFGMLNIAVGDTTLQAAFEDNSSAAALVELLQEGPLTLSLHDYGSFEKVGPLPASLPTNDTSITTQPGDVILYQGNQLTIYYDVNSWSFTRLAHIDGATTESLLAVLGDGDVEVTLSLG